MKPQKQKTQVNFPGKKYKPMVLQVKKDSPSVVTVYHEANSNAQKASIGINAIFLLEGHRNRRFTGTLISYQFSTE